MKSIFCLASISALALVVRMEPQVVNSDIVYAHPDASDIIYVSEPEDVVADLELPETTPQDDHYKWKWCPKKIYHVCKKKEYVAVTLKKGSYEEGKKICYACGGKLIEIKGDYERKCLSKFLAYKGYTEPVYIGSWNGDDYGEAGIALYPTSKYGSGAIAIPREGKKGPLYAFCEFKKYYD